MKATVKANEANKMGAKAPEKVKLQRADCKCDICGHKFLNKSALISHRRFNHKAKPLPAKRVPYKKETSLKKGKTVPILVKKYSSRIEAKKAEQMPPSDKQAKIAPKPVIEIVGPKKRYTPRKIEFKCPKCIKVFTVYFSAFRHIQKYHCLDDNDEPVPPNSPNLIKPIRVEQTQCCKKFVENTEMHDCEKMTERISDTYMCLGCQQTFDNLVIFIHHVKGLHQADVEYYYFPNQNEFTAWKTDIEQQIKLKFVTLTDKQKPKQIYHCSHQPALKADKTLLCPSSLHVTEFENGLHVIYYKEHFGHTCPETSMEKFKKYRINILQNDTVDSVENNDSVYQHFKNLMTSLTINAAKVDISVLNTLLEKALDMSVIINNVTQEDETTVVNKNMTDDQISDVLAEVKTYPGKRKLNSINKDVIDKKVKAIENDENSKSNNLLQNKSVVKKNTEDVMATPLSKPVSQSPSFVDTYKDFVDQNFKAATTNSESTPKKGSNKKKIVMKTKMGQFKVRHSVSPKPTKESPTSPNRSIEFKLKPDFKYEVKEQENDCNILILKI